MKFVEGVMNQKIHASNVLKGRNQTLKKQSIAEQNGTAQEDTKGMISIP